MSDHDPSQTGVIQALPTTLHRNRVLGRFYGEEHGPLLIAVGGMHGNEPAGVLAIERVLGLLDNIRDHDANFAYRGRFVGLAGNVGALALGQRFQRYDLNRGLNPARVADLRRRDDLSAEDAEAVALTAAIHAEIGAYAPSHVVFIDLHTTTADGGFFSFVGEDPGSRAIALDLHAPVILGMLGGIAGTSLHYCSTAQLGVPTTALAFESGQHTDPRSVERAVSALLKTMRSIGAIHPRNVGTMHSLRLEIDAAALPKLVRLAYAHPITAADRFVMRPGYRNFAPVAQGEVLADDVNGEVRCPCDGLILMPLYQSLGEDGFFVVEEL